MMKIEVDTTLGQSLPIFRHQVLTCPASSDVG